MVTLHQLREKILDVFTGVKVNFRQAAVIFRAVEEIMAELHRPPLPASPGMGWKAWLACDERGISSNTLALMVYEAMPREEAIKRDWNWPGQPVRMGNNLDDSFPHDPRDFARCVGFLDAVPEARVFLPRMETYGPTWAAMVKAWAELEMLFREESPSGTCPKLFKRMNEIIAAANASLG
jgi:hypothetical protein